MDYLHTDWTGMSRNDWLGVVITVLAFVAMVVVYVLVLSPRKKERFNSHADMVLRDDTEHINSGDKK